MVWKEGIDGFSAKVENNVLIITYNFINNTGVDDIDNLTIEGLTIIVAANAADNALLKASVLQVDNGGTITGLQNNTTFARLAASDMLSVPKIDTSTPKTICPGKTMTIIATPVLGAQSYEWDLPQGVTRTDAPGNNTTGINAVSVMVTGAAGNILVKVIGNCGTNSFSPPYNITIKAAKAFTINGVLSGEDISVNAKKRALTTTPSGGVFSGNGISQYGGVYYFDPGEAKTGDHEITCTYGNSECEAIKIIGVKVGKSSPLHGLLTSYCKTEDSQKLFKVNKLRWSNSSYRSYIHHLLPVTGGVLTAISGAPLSSLSCSSVNISHSNQIYNYTFTPSRAKSGEVKIRAVVVYERWDANYGGWKCWTSSMVTLAKVSITNPLAPNIIANQNLACMDEVVKYSVSGADNTTYEWTVAANEEVVINGAVINQVVTTDDNINVQWKTSGIKKISVRICAGACLSAEAKEKTITVVAKPAILSFDIKQKDNIILL